MKMFINLFHKYLLHICYLLTTILDAEDVAVKTNPCLDGASCWYPSDIRMISEYKWVFSVIPQFIQKKIILVI